VTAMTNNKGIGMTEGEWNSIVLKNKESFEAEAARRKMTLHQQREAMRVELEKQVARRKLEESAKKQNEVENFKKNLSKLDEQKQMEE